ncbi:MAG: FAD binding domain-containing protein [Gammaproteobacteria bacterium]
MKPARFDYASPGSLDDAVSLLQSNANAKIMAGAQTLGPMLNLRLVQPELIVDITRIPDLVRVEETDDGTLYGACVTHAAIEDGRVPDGSDGALRQVARGIAYRAVRTRGTIGGSLAHADPAADWLSALTALGAEVVVYSSKGRRTIPVAQLMTWVFETALKTAEILEAVRVPRLSSTARFGYYKICRKTGEFAEAIGSVLLDSETKTMRAVVGATNAAPLVMEDATPFRRGSELDSGAIKAHLKNNGIIDAYELQLHTIALARAATQVIA